MEKEEAATIHTGIERPSFISDRERPWSEFYGHLRSRGFTEEGMQGPNTTPRDKLLLKIISSHE